MTTKRAPRRPKARQTASPREINPGAANPPMTDQRAVDGQLLSEYGIPPAPSRAQILAQIKEQREQREQIAKQQRESGQLPGEPLSLGRFFTKKADRPITEYIEINDYPFEIVDSRQIEYDTAVDIAQMQDTLMAAMERVTKSGGNVNKIRRQDAVLIRDNMIVFLKAVYRAIDPETPVGLIEDLEPGDRIVLFQTFLDVQSRRNTALLERLSSLENGSQDSSDSTEETPAVGEDSALVGSSTS